jgi:putative membrane protein
MNFFTGFVIGVFSLIPGISSGTILMAIKKYDYITKIISNWKKNIKNILIIILGIIIGVITFARILELLFYFFPNKVMILFGGFILFNIKDLIKKEEKPKTKWFILGLLIIIVINLLSTNPNKVIISMPKITILFLIYFLLCGMIDGFFTIIPGISGSMVMMILGPYFLYKSYLANLNFSNLEYLVPLSAYLIGDLLGFFIGSKFSNYYIKKYPTQFYSIILGMVFMSTIIILPMPIFTLKEIIIYLIFLLISYIFCQIMRLVF